MTSKAITGDLTQSSDSIAGDLSQSKVDFANHLENDSNQRILFSGKYGSGKTTFLKEYFNEKIEDYNAFFISPVKYSVGNNLDIFEYIKFDIVNLLLSQYYIEQDDETINRSISIPYFIKNNWAELSCEILELATLKIPVLSRIAKIPTGIKKIIDDFAKFEAEIKEFGKSGNKIFDDYIANMLNQKGSIFEEDLITNSIKIYLESIKREKNKNNVLIIDDLDRLDPEHIFRILNILSVHNDYLNQEGSNKFGFDKIIVVCDIDSIESIFHHRYGEKTDFNGYIDKFYSLNIYRFSFGYAIANYCSKIKDSIGLTNCQFQLLYEILNYLVNEEELKFRSIVGNKSNVKLNDIVLYTYPVDSNTMLSSVSKMYVSSIDFPFLKVIGILINYFGDINKLMIYTSKYLNNESSFNLSFPENSFYYENEILLLKNFISRFGDLNFYVDRENYHDYFPSLKYLNSNVKIQLQWNYGNMYNGETSYFLNAKLDLSQLRNPNSNRKNSNYSINLIFSDINSILKYIIDQGFSKKLFS